MNALEKLNEALELAVAGTKSMRNLVQTALVLSVVSPEKFIKGEDDFTLPIRAYTVLSKQNAINRHAIKAWFAEFGLDVGKNEKTGNVFCKRLPNFDLEHFVMAESEEWWRKGEIPNNPDFKLPEVKLDTLARDIARMRAIGAKVPTMDELVESLLEKINSRMDKAEQWASENMDEIEIARLKKKARELSGKSKEKTTPEIASNLENGIDNITVVEPSPKKADEPFMTPAARNLCRENDINPNGITGTGENGRITKQDVEAAIETMKAA